MCVFMNVVALCSGVPLNYVYTEVVSWIESDGGGWGKL